MAELSPIVSRLFATPCCCCAASLWRAALDAQPAACCAADSHAALAAPCAVVAGAVSAGVATSGTGAQRTSRLRGAGPAHASAASSRTAEVAPAVSGYPRREQLVLSCALTRCGRARGTPSGNHRRALHPRRGALLPGQATWVLRVRSGPALSQGDLVSWAGGGSGRPAAPCTCLAVASAAAATAPLRLRHGHPPSPAVWQVTER